MTDRAYLDLEQRVASAWAEAEKHLNRLREVQEQYLAAAIVWSMISAELDRERQRREAKAEVLQEINPVRQDVFYP